MFDKIKIAFNFQLDSKVKKIMSTGLKVCFVLSLFSTLILSLYITINPSYILYDLGTSLLKSFSMFMSFFFIYGISFNLILKEKR